LVARKRSASHSFGSVTDPNLTFGNQLPEGSWFSIFWRTNLQKLKPFTVITTSVDQGLQVHHVEAKDSFNAFAVVAHAHPNADKDMVCAMPGHLKEGDETFTLPGEGLVCTETVLKQSDVFGKPPRVS
jgi:hypothetical protein